jgi:hypothetical protein
MQLREECWILPEEENNAVHISNKRLLKALKDLEYLLGTASTAELVDELQAQGISVLDQAETSYTPDQIRAALVRIFGQDAADLLSERLEKLLSGT